MLFKLPAQLPCSPAVTCGSHLWHVPLLWSLAVVACTLKTLCTQRSADSCHGSDSPLMQRQVLRKLLCCKAQVTLHTSSCMVVCPHGMLQCLEETFDTVLCTTSVRVVQLCACFWALVLSGTGADLPLSVKKPIQRLSLTHTSLPAPTTESTLCSACKIPMVEGAGSMIQHTKVITACLFRHRKCNTTACSDIKLG